MPIQLRILAIILAAFFFIYTIRLVRKDRAEIRHMLKWFVLALILLVGSLIPDFGTSIAHLLGIGTLTSLALYFLVGALLLICLKYQISLISAEKEIKNLVQEVSLLKKRKLMMEKRKKDMNKILTITVPSYNTEKYIDECMPFLLDDSIVDDIEILVVSDGSKDKTVEVATKWSEKYPQTIRVIEKENGGHGSTINRGILEARGKYFKVVDGDDWVKTDNLVKLVDFLKKIRM